MLARRGGQPRAAAMLACVAVAVAVSSSCGGGGASPLRVGAVFPLSGPQAPLGREEYLGVDIARELVNQDGGVAGRPIELDTRDVTMPAQAKPSVDALRDEGVAAIVGAYSSDLSMPASAATATDGLVYWEAGAVADRITGRGLPTVFRVGATGANLGSNSGNFVVTQLAPLLHREPAQIRVSIVNADDEYARSVADAAIAALTAAHAQVVGTSKFNPAAPVWTEIIATLRAQAPDIIVLASHIPDGESFRRAMLAAQLHVGALIGSTMAQCVPEFGADLGADAVGVFASDRPGYGFDPSKLRPDAQALYQRFAQAWRAHAGGEPDEEALSGFSAAWALFHEVLPRAAASGHVDTAGITAAAHAVDLPAGSLPNGAGIQFASTPERMGQNLRATAVIWQWQAVRRSVVVWPGAYATGSIDKQLVPLPR